MYINVSHRYIYIYAGLFLVNDTQNDKLCISPLPPLLKVVKLGFWFEKIRNVLKHMQK